MGFNSDSTNTAAVLYGATDLRLESRKIQPPGPGEAQVKIISTTLCGSDLHYYAHGRNGTFALQHPLVLGHESSGIITALGPSPSPNSPSHNLHVGMKVSIECGIPCQNLKSCQRCKEGRYNLCPKLRFCSSAKTHPHLDGTLQTLLNHPISLLHPLPSGMTFDQGALAEPLSVIIHASRRAATGGEASGVKPGSNVLVFGAGAVGLMACMLARAQGARKVVCVDVNDQRLQFAKKQGFVGIVFNSSTHSPPRVDLPEGSTPAQVLAGVMERAKGVAQRIREVAGMGMEDDEGFDVVFECTGAEPCIQSAIYAARIGGKVMLVGMGTPNVSLPLSAAACREVDLIGVFRYANTYPAALALLSSGALEGVEKMITHRFPLEETDRAFDVMKRGVDDEGRLVVKVCIEG